MLYLWLIAILLSIQSLVHTFCVWPSLCINWCNLLWINITKPFTIHKYVCLFYLQLQRKKLLNLKGTVVVASLSGLYVFLAGALYACSTLINKLLFHFVYGWKAYGQGEGRILKIHSVVTLNCNKMGMSTENKRRQTVKLRVIEIILLLPLAALRLSYLLVYAFILGAFFFTFI